MHRTLAIERDEWRGRRAFAAAAAAAAAGTDPDQSRPTSSIVLRAPIPSDAEHVSGGEPAEME